MHHTRPLERYLPIAYLVLALTLTAVLLPTALRPPPQQPPTSGALSPDAPPDEPQVLLSELGRGQSTTAGVGTSVGALSQAEAPAIPVAPPRPSRGRCWGDPPRQVESIYSAPCVPAFTGRNAGATWRGVTATEVRWGLVHARSDTGYEGPVADYVGDGDEVVRSWRAWEEYFNKNFELYGRRLRLFIARAGTNGWQEGTKPRAAVDKVDREHQVMGVTTLHPSPAAYHEATRREGLMFFGTTAYGSFEKHDPFQWEFNMDRSRMVRILAELACKQLHARPVSFAGDPDMRGRERKLGLVTYHDRNFGVEYGAIAEDELRKRCGWAVTSRQAYNLDDDAASVGTVMTKFRADGVTTILYIGDPSVTTTTLTHAATQQRYFPEWLHYGRGGMDRNATAAGFSSEQWRNSIGISPYEMNGARPSGEDWYRSYKEIGPDREAAAPDVESTPWHSLLHVAGAIQMAGPKLTPHTIKEGLLTRWPPRPPQPNWAMGGGYGPGEWTWSKYVHLLWWDPQAPRPQTTSQGAYRYLYNGRRFAEGELPTEPAPFFKEGITQPPDSDQL